MSGPAVSWIKPPDRQRDRFGAMFQLAAKFGVGHSGLVIDAPVRLDIAVFGIPNKSLVWLTSVTRRARPHNG